MAYWDERSKRADARLERGEAAQERRIRKFYQRELRQLQKEIAAFYAEHGEGDVVEYRRALERMDPTDRDLLMRDCDEFARLHPGLAWMVDIRKDIYRLNRLEGLQASARLHLARATADAVEGLDEHFEQVADEAARAVADTVGASFDGYSAETVSQLVGTEWSDGRSYSSRIWDNADKLAAYVSRDLAQGLARGEGYAKLAEGLASRFEGQSMSNIMRVIQTEGTYVSRQAQMREMVAAGFTHYETDAMGDSRTCGACRALQKATQSEPIRFGDARVGENFPPVHPRCRCDVNPVIVDYDEWRERRRAMAGRGAEEVAGRFGASIPSVLGKKGRSVSGLPDPELVDGERFDPGSPGEVRRFIRKYATEIKGLGVEHVYIMDAVGRIWHAVGDGENVSYGGVELEGAYVLHNHPVREGERVSFGADDFQMLKTHPEVAVLCAVNDRFFYSVMANASIEGVSYNEAYRNVDLTRLLNGEEQQHLVMEWLDEHGYVDYQRQDIRDL